MYGNKEFIINKSTKAVAAIVNKNENSGLYYFKTTAKKAAATVNNTAVKMFIIQIFL